MKASLNGDGVNQKLTMYALFLFLDDRVCALHLTSLYYINICIWHRKSTWMQRIKCMWTSKTNAKRWKKIKPIGAVCEKTMNWFCHRFSPSYAHSSYISSNVVRFNHPFVVPHRFCSIVFLVVCCRHILHYVRIQAPSVGHRFLVSYVISHWYVVCVCVCLCSLLAGNQLNFQSFCFCHFTRLPRLSNTTRHACVPVSTMQCLPNWTRFIYFSLS